MISRRLMVSAPLLAGAATLVPARARAQAGTSAAHPCDLGPAWRDRHRFRRRADLGA